MFGMKLQFRLTGRETAGKFSIVESVAAPGGGPAFLHAHPAEETFIVLEGEFEFYGRVDGLEARERAGQGFIHQVAGMSPHGIRNVGATPGRVLLIFHPADIQEAFFREAGPLFNAPSGAPRPPSPPSPELLAKVLAIAAKHNIVAIERPR